MDDMRRLLDDLCTGYGFCGNPQRLSVKEIRRFAPISVEAFTARVMRCEGLDPTLRSAHCMAIMAEFKHRFGPVFAPVCWSLAGVSECTSD